jgi:hypothetical protein
MTEEEWLKSDTITDLISYLGELYSQRRYSRRKACLFGVACCYAVGDLIEDERVLNAIQEIELKAESNHGLIDYSIEKEIKDILDSPELDVFRDPRRFVVVAVRRMCWIDCVPVLNAVQDCAHARGVQAMLSIDDPVQQELTLHRVRNMAVSKFLREQLPNLRDIFGNPFRPVEFAANWRTSNVTELARTVYHERAFDRMPILADALMDAGCEDEQIIGHCRSDGPHVHGCWLLDLILGKP